MIDTRFAVTRHLVAKETIFHFSIACSSLSGAFSIGEDATIIPDHREGDPLPDLERTTRTISEYRYEYDEYGNWTERTLVCRHVVDGSELGERSAVDRRTLTYF